MKRADAREAPGDPRLAGVAELLRTVDDASRDAAARADQEGRRRLIAAVEAMSARGRRGAWVGSLAVAAAMLLVIGASLAFVHFREPPALTYTVEGGDTAARGYVSIAPGAASATVRFSDGSDVALASGSRGRVASTTADGSDVVLEAGLAAVHVVHRETTRWTIDAGPYAVRVTGTAFTVGWSADKETLDVWMRDGRVVVVGPAASQGVALVAGQHLRAEVTAGSLAIDSAVAAPFPPLEGANGALPEDGPSGDDSIELPDSPSNGGASRGANPRAAPGLNDASLRWPKLVEAGNYDAVLLAAHQQGEGAALASRSLGDVRALGDAARYRNDAALATRAYTALRSRFAKSREARTAAFLLGRVAEEQQHSPSSAVSWYDTYLRESPAGPLAGDALGRKMVLTAEMSGPAAARDLARDYLARFPRGSYASAARDLVK